MDTHLQSCLDLVVDATTGVSPEAALKRTGERWSPAEIVEHLQKSYSGTAKGFERCLEKNTPLATRQTMRQSLQTFAVINFGYLPEGRKAPRQVIPTGTIPLPELIDGVKRDLAWLDDVAVRTARVFGGVRVLDHPILGAFTVDQWLRFHLIHTRHHERQIRARR